MSKKENTEDKKVNRKNKYVVKDKESYSTIDMVVSALEVNEFTISNLIVENRKFLNLIKKCANTEKHKIKEAIKDIKGISY